MTMEADTETGAGAGTGTSTTVDTEPSGRLDPLLRPTREVLLFRRAGRRPSRWRRRRVPPAGPASWLRAEADGQALRLGRRTPGTEHVLLAVLAAYEVSLREPELVDDEDAAGGALLAGLGLAYARAYAELDADRVALPADPRSVEAYLSEVSAGQGTGPLVRTLLAEDTRARRLAEALGPVGPGA
ncbi:hypothetical protein [Kitasatospora sp. NPDC097643]|uniref:hypothetical protein n=1 Tax=Kitasatospora sp. NPDC097643 TaxID=3157230 RepID=UPI0033187DC0